MSQQPLSNHGFSDPLNALFLSPRVIDRTAFERFASQLNDLIAQAERGQSRLDEASREADAVEERLARAGIELELKAERIAGLIPSIDDRLDQIESVLEETVSRVSDPTRIEGQVERLIAGRLDSFDTELEELFRHASERGGEADDVSGPGGVGGGAGAGAAEGSGTGSVVRMANLEARLNAMESRLASLDREVQHPSPAQIESLSAQACEARDLLGAAILSASARIDTLSDQSEEVISILDTCVNQARHESGAIRARRDGSEARANDAIEQLDDLAGDASQRISLLLAVLGEREKAARMLACELNALIATMHELRSGGSAATDRRTG